LTKGTIIKGIKVILHSPSGIKEPDDESLPCKMEATFTAPQFMQVAFVFMHGAQEELIVRGASMDALAEFWSINGFANHPRLIECTVTDEDGNIQNFT
jgi:hypothetical protein